MRQALNNDSDFKIDSETSLPALRGDWEGREGGDFKMPTLYNVIVEHQKSADWWENRDWLELFRAGSELLIKRLNIRVKDTVYLGIPLIKIERLNIKTVGGYRPEPDGYAILGTVCFNESRLGLMPDHVWLAYLLKFLLCAWRHQSGGKGDFDRECRERMKSHGVFIDASGRVLIEAGGDFEAFWTEKGLTVPGEAVAPPPRKGKATLKLWSCRCQKTRVGTKEFFANCPICGFAFELGDHVGIWPEGRNVTDTPLAVRHP